MKLEMGYVKTANVKTYGMQLKMDLGKTYNLYHRYYKVITNISVHFNKLEKTQQSCTQ